MTLPRRRFIALVALLMAPWGVALAQAPASVTIFVVRHAERASAEGDSPLSEVGTARAERLAAMLADAGITHAFSTEFVRTRSTVAPTAARAAIEPTVVPGRDLNTLIAQLRSLPAGSRALVAGHSNTVAVIVARLTGKTVAALTEADYDRLYVVSVTGEAGDFVLLRF